MIWLYLGNGKCTPVVSGPPSDPALQGITRILEKLEKMDFIDDALVETVEFSGSSAMRLCNVDPIVTAVHIRTAVRFFRPFTSRGRSRMISQKQAYAPNGSVRVPYPGSPLGPRVSGPGSRMSSDEVR